MKDFVLAIIAAAIVTTVAFVIVFSTHHNTTPIMPKYPNLSPEGQQRMAMIKSAIAKYLPNMLPDMLPDISNQKVSPSFKLVDVSEKPKDGWHYHGYIQLSDGRRILFQANYWNISNGQVQVWLSTATKTYGLLDYPNG